MSCRNPQDTNTTLLNIETNTAEIVQELSGGIPVTGPVTVVQPDGTQLHVTVDNAVDVNVSAPVTVVQPVGTQLHVNVDNSPPTIPAGLNIAGRITTLEVMTTAITIPAVPLASRNAMSITNLSNEILYIGFDNMVTADRALGTTAGWEVGPNESFNIDVQGSIPIYGIAAVGPILVKVMELS